MVVNKEKLISVYNSLRPCIHHTPLMSGKYFNKVSEANVFFKCENFQKAGSFKIRGALYATQQILKQENKKIVVTHSSGNFGQALAYAAYLCGIRSHVIVPGDAPRAKVDAMKGYGAEIEFCEPGIQNREAHLEKYLIQNSHSSFFIHPYNHEKVMEGHTSMVYEIFLDKLVPDVFVVPIGGGGLISGVSIAAHEWFPSSVVIGVEPENAKDALLSVEKGEIVRLSNVQTIADGLKTSLGDLTFPVIRKHVERIVTVSEEEIKEAQIEIMSRLKIVTEPSSATVWAAIKKYASHFKGKQIVAILSGGNIDFT